MSRCVQMCADVRRLVQTCADVRRRVLSVQAGWGDLLGEDGDFVPCSEDVLEALDSAGNVGRWRAGGGGTREAVGPGGTNI